MKHSYPGTFLLISLASYGSLFLPLLDAPTTAQVTTAQATFAQVTTAPKDNCPQGTTAPR